MIEQASTISDLDMIGLRLSAMIFSLILLFDYLIEGRLQRCLTHFATTEYHFIPISVTKEVYNCISSGSQNEMELKHQCPYPFIILTESLELKLWYKILPNETYIVQHTYFFSKTDRNRIFKENDTNIYEQLKIGLNGCTTKSIMMVDHIIMQVFYIDNKRAEYAYLFLVHKKHLDFDEAIVGFIMVPYKAFSRSVILTESKYKRISNNTFIYNLADISGLSGCDLLTLWKRSCQENRGNQKKLTTNLFWTSIVVLLYVY